MADVRYDLRKPPAPTIYILLPLDSFRTLHVRVAGDATTIAARIREEVRAATPLLRVTSVTSQAAMVNRTLVRERLLALLAGFFALVGLVLTAVGLYGTLSYAVVQRTREIGIRVALGARAVGAVRSVLADTAGTTLIGAACGLAGGLYASRFVETMLFEVAARDAGAWRCHSARCCWRRGRRPPFPPGARRASIRSSRCAMSSRLLRQITPVAASRSRRGVGA